MLNQRKQRRGLYRIRYPAGLNSDVRTREIGGTEELTISEPLYRARRYTPPFEHLPWHSDYVAAQKLDRMKSDVEFPTADSTKRPSESGSIPSRR